MRSNCLCARIAGWSFVLAALLLAPAARAADEGPDPRKQAAGYWEGTVNYGAEYFRDRKYMAMTLGCKADFWFTVDDQGNLAGEGAGLYDFAFALDWGLAASAGIQMADVLGLHLDPKVTLSLDPKSAYQRFRLTGHVEAAGDDGTPAKLVMQLVPLATGGAAPKLRLNLVAGLSGGAGLSAAGLSLGTSGAIGEVKQTIEVDPLPPFGTDEPTASAKLRSPYGPLAAEYEYDGTGTAGGTAVTVRWHAVQQISYQDRQRIEALERRVQELEAQAGGRLP